MNNFLNIGKKYWFVPKNYGWGLMPISWQGWVAVLVYIGLVLLYLVYGYGFDLSTKVQSIAPSDIVKMVFDICVSAMLFIYVMEDKTDGKVRWYWGNRP